MRRLYDGLIALLGLVCAVYWFGNSGAGLVILWLECRRSRALPDTAWLDVLEDDRLTFAHVGTYRIVVVGERSGRGEVFRDEVSEVDWTRLRRRCLTVRRCSAGDGS